MCDDIICFLSSSQRGSSCFSAAGSPLTQADPPPSSAPHSAIKNTSPLLLHGHEAHSNDRGACSVADKQRELTLLTNQLSSRTHAAAMLLSVAQHAAAMLLSVVQHAAMGSVPPPQLWGCEWSSEGD